MSVDPKAYIEHAKDKEIDRLRVQVGMLRSENAKLRELVADAHACKENDGCCEDCYADEGDCPIEQRMRELEIEVPK